MTENGTLDKNESALIQSFFGNWWYIRNKSELPTSSLQVVTGINNQQAPTKSWQR